MQKTLRQVLIEMPDEVMMVEAAVHHRCFKKAETKVKRFRNHLERCVEILNEPLSRDVGRKIASRINQD